MRILMRRFARRSSLRLLVCASGIYALHDLPARRAFFEERIDAFALIGSVEQIDETFALQRERSRTRHAVARLMNQRLAEADRLRTQPCDARRHNQRGLARSALFHDLFDETDAQRGRR